MDPLSVSFSIIAVLQLAQSVSQVLRTLRNANDARFDHVYWLAVAERERTVAWANKVQHSGQPIPPENVERVGGLLKKMKHYYDEVDWRLQKVYRPYGEKLTTRLLTQRLWFATSGFDDIKTTLEAIHSMNEALERIAPPLPEYVKAGESAPARSSDRTLVASSTVNTRAWPVEAEPQLTSDESLIDKQSLADHSKEVSLASLYRICLDSLRDLSLISRFDQSLSLLLSRLELWGIGLFDEDTLHLDNVLRADFDRNNKLRDVIAKNFVHIIIAEEQLLKIGADGEGVNKSETIKKDRLILMALLGKDDLILYAIERWGDLLTSDLIGTDKESVLEEDQSSIHTELDPIDEQVADLYVSIGNLFDLLPAIRAARQKHLLSLEALQRTSLEIDHAIEVSSETPETSEISTTLPPTKGPKFVLVPKHVSLKTLDLAVERNLRLAADLEEALRSDEEFAKTHGIEDFQVFSPRIQKEHQRLRQYREILAQGSDIKLGPEEQAAVTQLTAALQDTVKRLMVTKDLEKRPKDSPAAEKPADSEKRIEALIGVFQKSNSVLLGSQIAMVT